MRLGTPILLIMILAQAVSGCIRGGKGDSASLAASGLVLSGVVQSAGAVPRQGVKVYLDSAPDSVAITDASGIYKIVLPEGELTRLSAAAPLGRPTFNLFFEAGDDRGLSTAIAWNERGDLPLPAVTLAPASSVQGVVLSMATGRKPAPTPGVLVRLGRARVTTDLTGHFVVDGLPAGLLTVSASAVKSAAAARDVVLVAGDALTLDAPLVLFPETGVHGLLVMEPAAPQAVLNAAGHPFLRTFRVVGGKDAMTIRVHHDPTGLMNAEFAPWKAITDRFDYDFPRDGGHILFYQFGDATHGKLSDIYTLNVVLDQYALGTGFVVEDGSGKVNRRDVVLNIDVPDSAYRMRIAETELGLEERPWLVAQAAYPFTMSVRAPDGGLSGFGMRTIYLQFIDAYGFLSPVYQQTVSLELFPPFLTSVFTIEGGAPLTANRLVRVDATLPPNAMQMRIFEGDGGGGGGGGGVSINGAVISGSGGGSAPWLVAEPVKFYAFNSPGMKVLRLQFRSIDGSESPVYEQQIRVDPFAASGIGFDVNGGAPVSDTRYLDITLHPPPSAVAFRVFEPTSSNSGGGGGGGGFGSETWVSIVPHFNFEVRDSGVRTIFVKYMTIDGDESDAYSRTIYVNPFPPGSGDVVVNGGDPVALLSTLGVEVFPPAHAVAMAVTVGFAPDEFNADWLELVPYMELQVSGTGPKTVYVRFKSVDGTVSPAIQRTIFFEPFPFASAGVEINADAPTTSDPTVQLTFYGLANLLELRYAETSEDLFNKPFLQYVSGAGHTFSPDLGLRTIYVQYRTATGEQSPVYFDEITLTP